MMMLADADAQAWAIGPPLQGKVIQTANVTHNGKQATAHLMPPSQRLITVPSMYGLSSTLRRCQLLRMTQPHWATEKAWVGSFMARSLG